MQSFISSTFFPTKAEVTQSSVISPINYYSEDSTIHGASSLSNYRNSVASSTIFNYLDIFNAAKTQCSLIPRPEDRNLSSTSFGSTP